MRLLVTHNFRRNLDGIHNFLRETGEESLFQPLLQGLFGQVFPRLEQFPQMGVDFCRREAGSIEILGRVAALQRRLGQKMTVRELLHGDYLIFYAIDPENLYVLSIRHHRQLSFDLPGYWPKLT